MEHLWWPVIPEVMKNTLFSLVVENLFPFLVFVNEMECCLVLAVVVFSFFKYIANSYIAAMGHEEQQRRQQISTLLFLHSKSMAEVTNQRQRC